MKVLRVSRRYLLSLLSYRENTGGAAPPCVFILKWPPNGHFRGTAGMDYLGNSWTHCTEIRYVLRGPLVLRFMGVLHHHVGTCSAH